MIPMLYDKSILAIRQIVAEIVERVSNVKKSSSTFSSLSLLSLHFFHSSSRPLDTARRSRCTSQQPQSLVSCHLPHRQVLLLSTRGKEGDQVYPRTPLRFQDQRVTLRTPSCEFSLLSSLIWKNSLTIAPSYFRFYSALSVIL